jgi:hypothetical protein
MADGSWTKLTDYDAGKWFTVHEFEPTSFSDLADLVLGLRGAFTLYVIRGELNAVGKAQVASDRCIRRCHTTDRVSDPPISDAPQQWVMGDLDNYKIPAGFTLGSERLIRHAIHDVLPPEFHKAACVWTLSASSGLTTLDLLKCHLWFWLDQPVTSALIRETFRQRAPRIDLAPCSPSQPHYTADPILEGGIDPFSHCRAGVLRGTSEVKNLQICLPKPPSCNLGEVEHTLSALPPGQALVPPRLVASALARPKGEGRRLWTLLFGAAARALENGWDISESELARDAKAANSVFDRPGLEREAGRAIQYAKLRVQPLDALEQQRRQLRWQLSQPLNEEQEFEQRC